MNGIKFGHPRVQKLMEITSRSQIWQHRMSSFHSRDTKLDKFLGRKSTQVFYTLFSQNQNQHNSRNNCNFLYSLFKHCFLNCCINPFALNNFFVFLYFVSTAFSHSILHLKKASLTVFRKGCYFAVIPTIFREICTIDTSATRYCFLYELQTYMIHVSTEL